MTNRKIIITEEAENDIAELYDDIWTALEDEDNINFIKGDLQY